MRSKLARVAGGLVVAIALLAGAAPALANGRHAGLQFLGQAIVPTGTTFDGTTVGGLSSITYDARRGVFYSLSDDPSQFNPARFYTVGLDIRDGQLTDGDVHFQKVTTLLAPDGQPYAPFSLDPEGLALTRDRRLILTSEGVPATGIDPFVRRYALDGSFQDALPVPPPFQVAGTPASGVRPNLGFESAGVSPDGRFLFSGTENALFQDGPAATLTTRSPSRLMRYELRSGRLDRQWVYVTDPVAEPPVPADAFSVNGLVELLPLNDRFLIAMERSFSVGAPGTGNSIKLYTVALPGATNVNGLFSLQDKRHIRPVRKSPLLDLATLGIPLDNVEGLTFGPRLRDGRQTVVLVSDNNFAATQFTQFLLFAIGR
jgi:hypothetical protein